MTRMRIRIRTCTYMYNTYILWLTLFIYKAKKGERRLNAPLFFPLSLSLSPFPGGPFGAGNITSEEKRKEKKKKTPMEKII